MKRLCLRSSDAPTSDENLLDGLRDVWRRSDAFDEQSTATAPVFYDTAIYRDSERTGSRG